MKKLLVSILIMSSVVLYGCQNEAISEEDEAILEKNSVKKDLKWMEEMNEDTISSDAILQIREEGNLGPTVQYSKRMEDPEDEEGRKSLYVSFQGNKFEFKIGFDAPNVDSIIGESLNEKEREDELITLPHLDLFAPFIDKDDITSFFAEETKWEITAADVTGDGVLELIVIAQDFREITAVRTIAAIYTYTGDEEEPFELVTQFTGHNLAKWLDQAIYFTEANEFIQEEDKVKKARAYYEDGIWYTEDNGLVDNVSDSSLFYYDEDFELVEGENTNKEDDPRVLLAPVATEEEEAQQTDEENDALATEEYQAGLDAITYAELSTEARTEGDYERVFEYVKSGSPIDDELKKLIKDNRERGVELTYEGGKVVTTEVLSSGEQYDVTIRQQFNITGVEKEGFREFESVYRMEYNTDTGIFEAVELIDEIEI